MQYIVYRFVDGDMQILFRTTTEEMAITLATQYGAYYYQAA